MAVTATSKSLTFDDLPFELHAQIFQDSMDTANDKYLASFRVLELQQVCKSWRNEIDAMPSLWSTVYVTPLKCQEELARFETILSKAASLPWHFFFLDEDDCDDISPSDTAPLISALREPITRNAHRLATVDIQLGWPPDWLPPLLMSLFHDLQCPMIASVNYFTMAPDVQTPQYNEEAEKFWASFSQYSHQIKQLTAIPSEWLLDHGHGASRAYTWSSVTNLCFFWIESLRSFFSPLQHCENLMHLEIQYAEDCDQSEWWIQQELVDDDLGPLVIELPRLVSAYIHFYNMEGATTLSRLSLPSLKWLGLAWYTFGSCPLEYREAAREELPKLMERSGCKIINLFLSSSGSEVEKPFSIGSQPRELLDVLLEPDDD